MKNRCLRDLLISPTPIFFIIVFFGANLALSQCINSSAYATADAPSSGTVTISSCQYQTEYSTLNAVMAQTTYSCNYDLGGYITVRSGTYDGPIVKQGNSPLLWTAINSETHYIHWTTDAACGQATSCGTSSCDFISYNGSSVFVPFSGNNTYTLSSGTITDHAINADYNNYADGYTILYPQNPGEKIQLTGSIDTELNYDYVYIYDGETTSGTVLYEGSGSENIGTITSSDISGALTIKFTSDVSNVYSGFEFTINSASPCSGTPNAGSLNFSSLQGCPNETISITASGITNDANISYLWLKSNTINGTYTQITGETSSTINVSPSITTYYKFKSTCSTNNLSNETPIGTRDIYTVLATAGYTCGQGSVQLSASTNAGNIEWFSSNTGGSSIASGTNYSTPSLSQSTTYYVANSNCQNNRIGVIALVKSSPIVDAGTNDSHCYGESSQLTGNVSGALDFSEIGNGTSGFYRSPINRFYDYSCSEIIYLQSEINQAGPINTLAFNKYSGDNSIVISNITIYMKHVNESAFTDGTTSTSGYTQVYSGDFPNDNLGWNEITLTTPFNYDNINNLQILVVKGYEAYTSDRPYYKYTNSSPTNMNRMYYSDVTAWSSSSIMTADYWRPDIKFSIGNSMNYTWSPATGIDDQNSLTPISSATSSTDYSLTATSSNGCSGSASVTINVNPLPTINPTNAASCGDASLSLSASSSSATTINWYDSSNGGAVIHTGNSYSTPILNSTTSYFTSTTDANGCTTSPREEITATINAIPSANAGIDKNTPSMCGLSSVAMDAVLDPGFSGEWSVLSGVNVLPNDPTDPQAIIYPQSFGGTTIMQWEITDQNTGCQGSENVEVSFLQPISSNISSPQIGNLLWGGIANNAWNNSENWYEYQSSGYWKKMTSGEPEASDKVYLISGNDGGTCVSDNNYATLSANENVGDLSIMGGSSINLSNGSIYISGNIENNGSIIGNTGKVILNGSSNQNINGNAITFYDLEISKSGGDLTINTPITITNNLDMTQGNIQNTSLLTLGESSSKYGTLSYTSGFIHGAFKRYFPEGAINNVLFPVGKDGFEREMSISFNSSPGLNQFITTEFVLGTPGVGSGTYNGLPLTTNDGQIIQQYSNEGYWQIDPTNNDYNSSINQVPYSIKLHAKSMNGVVYRNIIRLIKSPGPSHDSWTECGNYASTIGTNNDDFYVVSENAIGFSFFGMGSNDNNALPVELISFNASCNEENVHLEWSTASEYNSDYFLIEKSRDGISWNTIHQENASGNSNDLIRYNYLDLTPLLSGNYYRLSQVDLDGSKKIEDAIFINCGNTNSSSISSNPNPSNNHFKLLINDRSLVGLVSIKLIDTQGNLISNDIKSIQKGINSIKMNKNLSKGMYYIIIESENSNPKKIKHIVQ